MLFRFLPNYQLMKQLFLFLFIVLSFKANAQTPESFLEKIQQNFTAEKIYLHYDKSSYIAGETIWFKAYIMDGIMPSTKSTVLCMELLNDSGKTIQKKILPINGSTAVGEFELPKKIMQGSYTVKAFTRTLMNFGFERYYYHNIDIYNPTSPIQDGKVDNIVSIYFLPEGGNLICNVKNTVAFKCADARGYPIVAEGKIIDAFGKVQTKFKSTFNGMGKFDFVPKLGEQYYAECLLNNIENKRIALPIGMQEGVAFSIYRTNEKTFFAIDASTVNKEEQKPSYILGIQENTVVFKSSFQGSSNIMNGEIPIQQLPSGILQITVFNKENKPLAERLAFINSGDYIPKGVFNASTIGLSARAKNAYTFNLEDTIAGSFSVAVTEFDGDNKKQDNIVSRFLLTDDIKGYVHEPAYYFENIDMEHQQNLDLVMLTNGWRRYSWTEIFLNRYPSMAFKDPKYITALGKAFDPSTGKSLINSELSIIVKTKDKKNDLLLAETDSVGNIIMEGLNFEDTAKFVFQSNTTKQRRVNLNFSSAQLSSIFFSVKTNIPKRYFDLPNEILKRKILNGYNFNAFSNFNGILLDEIKVLAKVKSEKEKYEKKYITGRMGSMPAKEIDFLTEPTTNTGNIFDYLRSRLNGVNISGGPINYSINYRNTRSLFGGPIQMNIFLDEFQVDPNQIATLRVQDVAMVQVFSNGGLSGGAGGSLAIYTNLL